MGGGRVGGVRVDVKEELKFFVKISKKILGGGGGEGSGWGGGGVRVDVNGELKFLGKFTKKNRGGGGGREGGGQVGVGLVEGSGWM